MSKLTEKMALQDSLDMWVWLLENPGKRKDDYPDIKALEHKYAGCQCSLCYYYISDDWESCTNCPLLRDDGESCPEYTIWVRFKHNHEPSAKAIVDKIKERLKEIEK